MFICLWLASLTLSALVENRGREEFHPLGIGGIRSLVAARSLLQCSPASAHADDQAARRGRLGIRILLITKFVICHYASN
jgi:hypothetical protein